MFSPGDLTRQWEEGVRSLGEFIRVQREQHQMSMRRLAEQAGVSNPYLSQIERGLRKPSAEILKAIAGALQIQSEVLFQRAGLLDADDPERDASEAVQRAVAADMRLSERQKTALLEVYRSFLATEGAAPPDS